LITSDDCSTYAEVLLNQYGETVVPPATGKRGRPRAPYKRWPAGSAYASVNKTYAKGTVTAVDRTLVHGTPEDLAAALEASQSSATINTSFVERQNGTDRSYNARKARKTYEFSKDLLVHVAVTWWVFFCYNFVQLHRGLRIPAANGAYVHRTPAMVLGIAQAPLSVADILITQSVGAASRARPVLADFRSPRATQRAP